jgi:hypothetical protein
MSANEPPNVPERRRITHQDALGVVISQVSHHEEKQPNVVSSGDVSLLNSVSRIFSFFAGEEREEIKDGEEKREEKAEVKQDETLFSSTVKNISNLITPAPAEEKKPLLPKFKK